jgi:DNA (cytosine-5)-methyltransferase 1
MKILNLYAGIAGNALRWPAEHQVTAIEHDPIIAAAYQQNRPHDTVIVGDAHEYLLQHHSEFDFVWSSPPCMSHSRFIRSGRNRKPRFVDGRLFEEILLLQHDYAGKWVVENVKSWYPAILNPRMMGRHAYWSNFHWPDFDEPKMPIDFINDQNMDAKAKLQEWLGITIDRNIYANGNHCVTQVYRNCVHPLTGQHILGHAFQFGLTE